MSVGEAIGWGTATVAVVIAVSLTTAAVLAVIDHWNQQEQLRAMKVHLAEAFSALEESSDGEPFELLRTIVSRNDQYLPTHTIIEGDEGRLIDLDQLRRDIGSFAAWELRSIDPDWYAKAMAFVAAYDTGRRQAAI